MDSSRTYGCDEVAETCLCYAGYSGKRCENGKNLEKYKLKKTYAADQSHMEIGQKECS